MKKNIYVLCVIAFLQGLVFYGPIATIFRQSRGLSMFEIFLLASVLMILMIAFEIPWGYFADRFGYKRTLLLSYFIFFLSKVTFYLSHSFPMFLAETILLSLALSGISGCDSALLYSSAGKEGSDRAFSLYNASGAAGLFMASFLSTFIIGKSMDKAALYTIIPYLLAFIIAITLDDSNYKKTRNTLSQSIKNAFKNKYIFIFVVSMSLISETTHSICVFLNQPQYLRGGIPITYFGLLTALMQVVCVLSVRSYRFSRKLGQSFMITALFIVITAASITLTFITNWAVSIILIALIEGSFALCQPLSSDIQNRSIITEDRATLLSVYAMTGEIVASVTNLSIGRAADISLITALLLCGILSSLASLLAVIYFRSIKKTNAI